MHRFFLAQDLQSGQEVELPLDRARQIRSVLRLRAGDRISLFNGDGTEHISQLVEVDRRVTALVMDEQPARQLSGLSVHLKIALLKNDKFELVVQKATELGVTSITPVMTQNTVVSLRVDRERQRLERWNRIAIEASEQSGRVILPQIGDPVRLDELIEQKTLDSWLIFSESAMVQPLHSHINPSESRFDLVVGPEGGLSSDEVAQLEARGARVASLGPLVLRSETAAIAAIVAIQSLYRARIDCVVPSS